MRFKYVYVFPGTGGAEVSATLGADDRASALLRARIECRTLGADLIDLYQEDHERWLELDVRFGTTPDSPLHHDARCVMCHGWNVR